MALAQQARDRGHHGTSGAGAGCMSRKVLSVPSQQLEVAQMLGKGLGNAELQGVVVNICGLCQELLMMRSQPIETLSVIMRDRQQRGESKNGPS